MTAAEGYLFFWSPAIDTDNISLIETLLHSISRAKPCHALIEQCFSIEVSHGISVEPFDSIPIFFRKTLFNLPITKFF